MHQRPRAFAAILHKGKIAMVKMAGEGRTFWTLPGGGVEEGEEPAETAAREAREEINLKVRIIRYLYQKEYPAGIEYCFLAEADSDNPQIKLGFDPELLNQRQALLDVAWMAVKTVKNDAQVSKVLEALNEEELRKYGVIPI